MLTGSTPFHPLRDAEISFKVLQGDRPLKPANASDSGISDGLWQLLARCWNADDSKRPQINEIFQHLCHEPARGWDYPPSGLSRAQIYESIPMSGTHEHGSSPPFKLACWRAYSLIDDIFHTTPPETTTEGMFGVIPLTVGLNTPTIRMSTIPNAYESYKH